MKVKRLIELLSEFNPNANVGIKTVNEEYVDHLYVSYICEDTNGNEVNGKDTAQVWIEAIDLCCDCQFFENNNCLVYDCSTSEVDECYQFIERE